jgi:hypothetical protein
MVKPKVEDESKGDRFKRLATSRTQKALNCIRLLGNLSNRSSYEYSPEEVQRIFSALDREVKRAKALFGDPSSKEFRL